MHSDQIPNSTWAILIARTILGLMFFMAGTWKVFTIGPVAHALNHGRLARSKEGAGLGCLTENQGRTGR